MEGGSCIGEHEGGERPETLLAPDATDPDVEDFIGMSEGDTDATVPTDAEVQSPGDGDNRTTESEAEAETLETTPPTLGLDRDATERAETRANAALVACLARVETRVGSSVKSLHAQVDLFSSCQDDVAELKKAVNSELEFRAGRFWDVKRREFEAEMVAERAKLLERDQDLDRRQIAIIEEEEELFRRLTAVGEREDVDRRFTAVSQREEEVNRRLTVVHQKEEEVERRLRDVGQREQLAEEKLNVLTQKEGELQAKETAARKRVWNLKAEVIAALNVERQNTLTAAEAAATPASAPVAVELPASVLALKSPSVSTPTNRSVEGNKPFADHTPSAKLLPNNATAVPPLDPETQTGSGRPKSDSQFGIDRPQLDVAGGKNVAHDTQVHTAEDQKPEEQHEPGIEPEVDIPKPETEIEVEIEVESEGRKVAEMDVQMATDGATPDIMNKGEEVPTRKVSGPQIQENITDVTVLDSLEPENATATLKLDSRRATEQPPGGTRVVDVAGGGDEHQEPARVESLYASETINRNPPGGAKPAPAADLPRTSATPLLGAGAKPVGKEMPPRLAASRAAPAASLAAVAVPDKVKAMVEKGDGAGLIKHHIANSADVAEMSAALRLAPDPSRLVLTGIQTLIPSMGVVKGRKVPTYCIRACTSMLEILDSLRPSADVAAAVGADVADGAFQLASRWMSDLDKPVKERSCLEVHAILMVIWCYGIRHKYTEGEVCALVRASDPSKTYGLCRALGMHNKVDGIVEDLKKDGRTLRALRFCHFFGKMQLAEVMQALDEDMGKLREEGQKSIRGRNPISLQDALKEEMEGINKVIDCFNDCKLQTKYSSRSITDRLGELQKVWSIEEAEKKRKSTKESAAPPAPKRQKDEAKVQTRPQPKPPTNATRPKSPPRVVLKPLVRNPAGRQFAAEEERRAKERERDELKRQIAVRTEETKLKAEQERETHRDRERGKIVVEEEENVRQRRAKTAVHSQRETQMEYGRDSVPSGRAQSQRGAPAPSRERTHSQEAGEGARVKFQATPPRRDQEPYPPRSIKVVVPVTRAEEARKGGGGGGRGTQRVAVYTGPFNPRDSPKVYGDGGLGVPMSDWEMEAAKVEMDKERREEVERFQTRSGDRVVIVQGHGSLAPERPAIKERLVYPEHLHGSGHVREREREGEGERERENPLLTSFDRSHSPAPPTAMRYTSPPPQGYPPRWEDPTEARFAPPPDNRNLPQGAPPGGGRGGGVNLRGRVLEGSGMGFTPPLPRHPVPPPFQFDPRFEPPPGAMPPRYTPEPMPRAMHAPYFQGGALPYVRH